MTTITNNIYNYVYKITTKNKKKQANGILKQTLQKTALVNTRKNDIDIPKIEFRKEKHKDKTATQKGTKFLSQILAKISPCARKIIAKHPKGSFERTNYVYLEPLSGKKHIVAYEGKTVDYDVTREGEILPKIRTYFVS